jgi:hypothetical protein
VPQAQFDSGYYQHFLSADKLRYCPCAIRHSVIRPVEIHDVIFKINVDDLTPMVFNGCFQHIQKRGVIHDIGSFWTASQKIQYLRCAAFLITAAYAKYASFFGICAP